MVHRHTSNKTLSDVEDLQRTWGTSGSPPAAPTLPLRGESAPVLPAEGFSFVVDAKIRSISSVGEAGPFNSGTPMPPEVVTAAQPQQALLPPTAAMQQLQLGQQRAARGPAAAQAPAGAADVQQVPAPTAGSSSSSPMAPAAQGPPGGAGAQPAAPAAYLDPFGGAAAAAAAAGTAPAPAPAQAPTAAYLDPFGGAAAAAAATPAGAAPAPAPAPAPKAAPFDPFGAAAAGAAHPLPDPFAQVAASAPPPPPPPVLTPPPEASFAADHIAWGDALPQQQGTVAAAAGAGGVVAAAAGAAAGGVVLPAGIVINTCTLGDDGDCTVETGLPLGSGSFGSVYPGRYFDDPVAVKMLRAGLGEDEATLQQRILREVQLQARAISHSGVVRFVAVCFSPPAIVMEMCECSLSARICNHWAAQQAPTPHLQHQHQQAQQAQDPQPQPMPQPPPPQPQPELCWRLVVQLLRQAAAALAFLHRPGATILHNDLRADNMVLSRTLEPGGGCSWKLKLCDFGLSVWAGAAGAAQVPPAGVTHPSWQGPELADGYDALTGMFTVTPAADVFALGCVLHEMLVPGLPQPTFPAAEARLPALADPPPAELLPLFKACVHQLPQQRPTAQAVMNSLRKMVVV